MDNFKYSLKTNQFNKKRQHIFTKQVDKQSLSLEVHQPNHSVQDLLDFNKSQDNYGLIEQFGNQITKQSIQKQQQSKIVKFNRSKQSMRKMSSTGIPQKSRNVCHSISASAKIKIPQINPELSRQKLAQSIVTTQELQALKYILYRNEQSLKNLTDSMNSLYRNTIQLYNNHERKMRQIVNNRCYQVVRIYKLAVMEIKQKQRNIDEMDGKITILLNTLKNNIDILRITKIKQQCIEALQQNQLQQKQKQLQMASRISLSKQNLGNASFLKINIPEFVDREVKNKVNSAKQTIPVHTFRKQSQKQYFTLRSNQSQFQDSLIIDPNIQSINQSYFPDYYDSPTPKSSIQLLKHKKSPFQANQLLLISSTTPVYNSQQNFEEVSFRKNNPYSEKYQIEETNKKSRYGLENSNVEQYRCRSMTQSMKISQSRNNFYSKKDQYENLKDKIKKLMKQTDIKQVWLDNLNCLRRKNGTYILDCQGNAVICSPENFQRLITDQIVVHPKF